MYYRNDGLFIAHFPNFGKNFRKNYRNSQAKNTQKLILIYHLWFRLEIKYSLYDLHRQLAPATTQLFVSNCVVVVEKVIYKEKGLRMG